MKKVDYIPLAWTHALFFGDCSFICNFTLSPIHVLPTVDFPPCSFPMAPVWHNKEDILWVGIFDINIGFNVSTVPLWQTSRSSWKWTYFPLLKLLMALIICDTPNLAVACGCEISLMCIWQGPNWAWGHVRLEALLSCRAVYGNRADVEHLRREAVDYLDDGPKRLDIIAEAVEKIKIHVAREVDAYRPAAYSRAKILFVMGRVHWRAQEGRQLVEYSSPPSSPPYYASLIFFLTGWTNWWSPQSGSTRYAGAAPVWRKI